MMKQLARSRCANHKAGWMIDGTTDRLGWLVCCDGGRLCPGSLTLSNLWSMQPPHCLHPILSSTTPTPHQLPVTPHHSSASACHVLGVKGFPPIAHQNGTPTISCPPHTKSQSIAGQTEMDWDVPRPCTFQWTHPPFKGLLSLANNRGDIRRSVQVKSAAPGRKFWQRNGGIFFSL